MKIEINLVKGVEGLALYLNNYRVCGPKPWGGGKTVQSWMVPFDRLKKALGL